jgi:formamidopyrimidine-DNA glycosylase
MPEGPECKLHAERLHAVCEGQQLCRAQILSGRYHGEAPPEGWETLQTALPLRVREISSKGKFIFWRLEPLHQPGGVPPTPLLSLWSTLGMTGAWSRDANSHARLALELGAEGPGEERWRLYYNDQRNFGTLRICGDEELLQAKLKSLGPAWLGTSSSPPLELERFLEIVARQCRTKRGGAVPLAKFLMDQKKTSGIGNYILSESLFLASLWPMAKCADLDGAAWADLHAAVRDVITRSYTSQSALAAAESSAESSASSHRGGVISATRGTTFTFQLYVYGRSFTNEGLRVRKDVGPHGRSIFWVPQQQQRAAAHPPV